MPSKQSLEEQVAELALRVGEMQVVIDGMRAIFTGGSGPAGATDAELDSPKGDPTMRFQPKNWTGGPRKGYQLSRCEADCLDAYAEQLDYFAQLNDEKGVKDNKGGPKSRWDRLDAKRARGWARRLRAGWVSPAGPPKPTNAWGQSVPQSSAAAPVPVGERAFDGFEGQQGGGDDDSIPLEAGEGDDAIPFATSSFVRPRLHRP